MASAQVLPSSRKQELLAAGKRRLEEFRRKKAADRAEKSNSSNNDNITPSERQPSDSQVTMPANFDGSIQQRSIQQPSISETDSGAFDISQRSEQDSEFLINDTTNVFSRSSFHMHAKDKDRNKIYEVSSSNGPVDHSINQETPEMKGNFGILGGSFHGPSDHDSKGNVEKIEAIQQSSIKGFGLESGQAMLDVAIADGSEKLNINEGKLTSSSSRWRQMQTFAPYTSPQYSSASYSSDYSKSSDDNPLPLQPSEAQPRRSRPSFLDSLNVPRAPSLALPNQYAESREPISGNDTEIPMDSLSQSAFGTRYTDNLATSTTAVSNGKHLPDGSEHSVEKKPEFYLHKKDEDFAALEQHIEDLTQEKFTLQRALEASRTLAESLASENSSLTDSYNQQRSAVNQLKADMENLQEEISRQLAELESLKHEYANAQLECNAADERAKLLASEVIGLEEKALKLRSSELKLERQLENSQAEITAYKKKVSSLEKERLDLQSTISALQEEKKMLQSKLRKSSGGNSIEPSQSSASKKDMSTSTDDLDASIYTSTQQMEPFSIAENDSSTFLSSSDTSQLIPESSFTYIPPDQLRMVESISTIISELASEKEELVRALASEMSDNSKLKDLNKDLSRKLEAQTQILELLTAQSMANNGNPAKHPDPRSVLDNTAYADEGDEVVERVLGWIMKLFPGGPSRQRTRKLM